jgi:hypothetical protein
MNEFFAEARAAPKFIAATSTGRAVADLQYMPQGANPHMPESMPHAMCSGTWLRSHKSIGVQQFGHARKCSASFSAGLSRPADVLAARGVGCGSCVGAYENRKTR